jgi:NADH-quinone oxidoreductase subunit C
MASGLDSEKLSEPGSTNSDQNLTPSHLVAALKREHPEWVSEVVEALGEITAIIPREHITAVCTFFKTTPVTSFDFLSDICGVDRGPEEDPRFEVNYHLFSTTKHHRIRFKVLLSEDDPHVASVTSVWRTANWHERETFDLLGVIFDGHPDLRRILLPDDWQGHALRKDFPLRGYEPYSLK